MVVYLTERTPADHYERLVLSARVGPGVGQTLQVVEAILDGPQRALKQAELLLQTAQDPVLLLLHTAESRLLLLIQRLSDGAVLLLHSVQRCG